MSINLRVAELAYVALEAGRRAQRFYELTGEHDPILQNVRVQMPDGSWRSIGNQRLSDIGHLRVITHDVER